MTNNIQEHHTSLDLGGHTARNRVGCARMPGLLPGIVELATSFLATDTCTDIHGPRGGEKGLLLSRGLAMEEVGCSPAG
jgi:hypothetical protein